MGLEIKTDKLHGQYTQKIPEILAKGLSDLTPEEKKKLNLQVMVTLAKAIHDHRFNPVEYLTTQDI